MIVCLKTAKCWTVQQNVGCLGSLHTICIVKEDYEIRKDDTEKKSLQKCLAKINVKNNLLNYLNLIDSFF